MARTLVASDNFNRASLGADWAMVNTIRGNVVIDSSTRVWGEYAAIGDDHPTARWVGAGTFSDDQYSSAVIIDSTPPGSTYRFGVVVRASADTNGTRDYYEAYVALITGLVTTHLTKVVNGTKTDIYVSSSPTWADNDRIELEVQGTTLRVCKNGTPLGGSFTATDSSITTGKPGLSVTNQMYLDDWEGGDMTADGTAPTLTSPTATTTGSTTASGSVTTNEANGVLYRLASTNTTELVATVKAAALTQSVSATGVQPVNFTGLTAATTYYAHYVHTDAAANDSTRVSSASFTTSGAGPTINTQPAAQTANEAATATFTVAATTSGGALSYQWKRQPPGGGAFANVGTNSTSYTTATLDCATDHGANVYCAVTDSNGTTNTNAVGLTVLAITSTVRPIADITTAGWVASTGTDFYALIDEAVADDVDYITSPAVSVTPAPIKFSLSYPWAAGTRRIRFNAKGNGGTPTMRVKLLNDADTVVGTSAGQVVTAIWAAYDIEIVLSGTATRGTIEFVS